MKILLISLLVLQPWPLNLYHPLWNTNWNLYGHFVFFFPHNMFHLLALSAQVKQQKVQYSKNHKHFLWLKTNLTVIYFKAFKRILKLIFVLHVMYSDSIPYLYWPKRRGSGCISLYIPSQVTIQTSSIVLPMRAILEEVSLPIALAAGDICSSTLPALLGVYRKI